MQEIRDRKHFEKPSTKRAKAKAAGRARWLKKKREIEDRQKINIFNIVELHGGYRAKYIVNKTLKRAKFSVVT